MSILETRMQNLRESAYFDKNEERGSRHGAFNLFRNETDSPISIVSREMYDRAISSIGRQLQTPVLDYNEGLKITNTRRVTIQPSELNSKMVNIDFSTLTFEFTVVPAAHHNNEIGVQKAFESQMIHGINAMAKALDEMGLAALEASKTKVFGDKLGYNIVGDTVKANWSEQDTIFGDISAMQGANDYYNMIHIVGNAGVESAVRKLAQSGIYNAVNKRNEFDNKVFHFTNNLLNGDGVYASMFAVESGQVALLHRFERESLYGTETRDGHRWGTTVLPGIDMPCGTYFYEEVGDYSTMAGAATADMTRAKRECYCFSVDVAFVTPYNSRPTEDAFPIISAEILSKGAADATLVKVISDTPGV